MGTTARSSRFRAGRATRATLTLLAAALTAGAFAGTAWAAGSYSSAVLADAPSGYWRLGESLGATTAADSGSGGYAGAYHGVVTGIDGALDPDTDTAASFAGTTSSWLDLGAVNWFEGTGSSFSVEAWVSTMYDGGTIVSRSDSGGFNWSLSVDTNSACLGCAVARSNDAGDVHSVDGPSDTPIDDGLWHHVVAVFGYTNGKMSQRTITVYVDGVGTTSYFPTNLGRLPGETPESTTAHVLVGQDGEYGLPLNGNVDEVAVYPTALTAAQVQAHYDAGSAGPDQSGTALTAEQVAKAQQLATTDPAVTQLLGGNAYSVGSILPWTRSDGSTFGARVRLDLGAPATVGGTWPDYAYDDSQSPAYTTGALSYTANAVSSLLVSVDLECGTVIGVEPGPDLNTSVDGTPTTVSSGNAPACDPAAGPDPSWVHNVRMIHVGSDWFYNYSYEGKGFDTKVSWPIDVVFMVKDRSTQVTKDYFHFYSFNPPQLGCTSGSPCEYSYIHQGSDTIWAADEGTKTEPPGCWDDVHMRVYSAGQAAQPSYNPAWGYFFVAATHFDHHEECPWGHRYFGNGEQSEHEVVKKAQSKGWTTYDTPHHGAIFLHNRIHGWPDNSHFYDSDGWAAKVLATFSP